MSTKLDPGHPRKGAKSRTAESTGNAAEPSPGGLGDLLPGEAAISETSARGPDERKPPGPLRVEGYETCVCGAMILTQLAYLTSGVCLECFMNGTGRYLRETELRHEARQRSIKLKSTVPSRRGVKKNAVTTKNGRLVEHAKRAAFRRLRSWVPDLWDIAYALEREARGLPCLPLRKPPGHFVEAVATAARNGVYAPGSSGGVSGAQDEDPGTAGQ